MTEPEGADGYGRDDEAVRKLLRRALRKRRYSPDLLAGIQHRIRQRSCGKFFSNGWSVRQGGVGHVWIGLATLLLVAVAYCVLGPIDLR
ncbi:MAG: hypothetical protein ABSF69_04330 [Polyangiaceae bacterium]|jgi:hypothetical protein